MSAPNSLLECVDQIMAGLEQGDLNPAEAVAAWKAERATHEKETSVVQGLFDSLDKWGAALLRLVPRDENDVALRAVIAVQGQPETDEVLAALDRLEGTWNDD
jgi:hypothetical protein